MGRTTLWAGLVGVAIGVCGAVATRSQWVRAVDGTDGAADENCKTGCKPHAPSAAVTCPARYQEGTLVITDAAEMERVRAALLHGVFAQWVDLGRAPTPTEIGAALKLDPPATDAIMDKLAACGAAAEIGIHRVPDSELIAVAWPFSNVPTGIDVTVDGKKTVHARCAIDALGVSKMMGKKATVDALSHDGVKIHVEVDGDHVVSATPADAVVLKGAGCDQMMFFSSQAALDVFKKDHPAGRTFKLEDAVLDGAQIFGPLARPFAG